MDAPFNRPEHGPVGSDPLTGTPKDRDEQIQLIVDLRRAVDLLIARPDVNSRPAGLRRVQLRRGDGRAAGRVEHRLKAYVLASGDGGLVSHFSGPDDTNGPLQTAPPQDRERWLAAMWPIEPINFSGRAAPAALLFQAGTMDVWHGLAGRDGPTLRVGLLGGGASRPERLRFTRSIERTSRHLGRRPR